MQSTKTITAAADDDADADANVSANNACSLRQRVRDKAKYAVLAANNHYTGFGPATANSFRKMVGLREAIWEEMKKQKRL